MAKTIQEFKQEGSGWRIKVTTADGTEFFSQEQKQPHRGENSFDAEYLMRFHIPFDRSPDSNVGDLWLYNLEKQTITKFKRNELLKMEACFQPYEKHHELLYKGTIEDCLVDEVNAATRTLRVRLGDTTDLWPVKVTSKTYSPGVKAKVVAEDLINELTIDVGRLEPKENPTYTKGLSMVGAIRPELEMVVRDMKSKLHVSRRQVFILDPQKGVPSGVVLTPDNGLLAAKPTLSVPEDMQYVETLTDDESPVIYEIKALLTPKLWTDSEFEIAESKNLNGNFRILRGSHDCDGLNFLTTVWAVKI